jgi:hypothetical protein
MPKLAVKDKFIDLSDYGRPAAQVIVRILKNTEVTAIHLTLMFGLCGITAVFAILNGNYIAAGLLLILKSILDAADGEMARMKKNPSYVGRYLDSVFDFILNFIIIMAVWFVTGQSIWLALAAFASIQLQGTLYNFYYVILRHNSESGDRTSKIFETETPEAYPGESQESVDMLFRFYTLFYSIFDKIIYALDRRAPLKKTFPKWFMTFLSMYGLGFQLLIISIMLATGFIDLILPFFVFYSLFILIFVGIRRTLLPAKEVNT